MKQWFGILICGLLLLLAGCSQREEEPSPVITPSQAAQIEVEVELSPAAAVAAVAASQSDADGLMELSYEILSGYLSSFGLVEWEEAAVLTGQGMDGREITVVRMSDENAAKVAALLLEEHRQARVRDFFGYAPAQADMLERAQVLVQGNYAAFLACEDERAAKEAFAACFDEGTVTVHTTPMPEMTVEPELAPSPEVTPEPTPKGELIPTIEVTPEPTPEPTSEPSPELSPEPSPTAVLNPNLDISRFPRYSQPNDVDMTLYDNTAVVNAWNTGNETGLSDKDRIILNRCREIFAEVIREDMTDFEKELALHEWLLDNGEYDALSRDNVAHIGLPDNNNPYGMLVGGYGICLGFTTTFQLFMDLAGIECISVVGAAYNSTADHAWNMVKLDGEWYCVDVTWNESGEEYSNVASATHKYFNVTSAFLRNHSHQWDYRNTPETAATRYHWDGVSKLPK